MKTHYLIYLLLTILFIFLTSGIIVLFASGYRLDLETKTLHGTGIISISSAPDGALVSINDVPKDATNTSITELKPGIYNVRLEKEGYVQWTKEAIVKGGLVTKLEALLIPLYPSLKPLTFTGVNSPVLSPDGQKIVYLVNNDTSAGIWLVSLEEKPFNLNRKPQLLIEDTEKYVYSQSKLTWSPESNTLLLETADQVFLFELSTHLITPVEDKEKLLEAWKNQEGLIKKGELSNLTINDQAEITDFENPLWSPDDNFILHSIIRDNEISYQIYPVTIDSSQPTDVPKLTLIYIKRDQLLFSIPKNIPHYVRWFPDSQHLIIIRENTPEQTVIEIIDIDGSNHTQLFSGTIKNLRVYPNPSGSKIITLTKFNPQSESFNLYSINLR